MLDIRRIRVRARALVVAAAKSHSESPRGIYMLIKEMKFPVYGLGLTRDIKRARLRANRGL